MIAALGSKEGFANLAQAITAPGDVVLVPNPAYPIHAFGFILAGAAIRHVPATSPEEYLSALGRAVRHSVPSPLALVVNYPSNPDGAGGGSRFLQGDRGIREEARDLGAVAIWPMPISISTTCRRPRSCRSTAPRTSPSNSSPCPRPIAMPGWRMGFAAGNEKLIGALARIKSYLDYGAYHADPGGGGGGA